MITAAELIEQLAASESARDAAADAALEDLIARAAAGQTLETSTAFGIIERAGITAAEFSEAVEHAVKRREWEAEAAKLPDLEAKLAAVQAAVMIATEDYGRAISAANSAYSKAAAPLDAERTRLLELIASAEAAKAMLETAPADEAPDESSPSEDLEDPDPAIMRLIEEALAEPLDEPLDSLT